ncbi:MAG: hypothetical protein OQJ74_02905, partial [Ignavibacteriaceae bacterium]|nr:hypothetical protein [Ignavibacteriaceae bacterium]
MNLLTYLFKIKKIFGTYPLLFLLICLIFSTTKLFSQGFSLIREISPVNATAYTGDKPQSKIWNAAGYSWTVIPVPVSGGDPAGTYLFRLDNDTTWQKLFLLDPATDIKADVKSYGDTTHIILKQKNENNGSGGPPQIQQVKLISLELVNGSPPTYQLWSVRNSTVLVGLKNFAETATMDIDSQGRMWLACDGGGSSGSSNKDIYVKWSDRPYSNWSSYINMNGPSEQVDADDICSIKAFGSTKIGVFWSDQNLDEFRFRYHNDSDGPTTWSTLETAAGGDPGAADDHLNLAAASDGTIYVAAKTSYDSDGQPNLILLVRRPSG